MKLHLGGSLRKTDWEHCPDLRTGLTGKVDTRKVGTYSIKYSVSDSEGDTTTLDQTVIVEEVIAG